MARLTDANVLDRQGDHRPLPAPEVGADPVAPPGPGAGRVRHRRGDGPHRRAARHHAGRGLRHGVVLRDVQVRADRPLLHQHLHEHLVPAARGVGAARARRAPPRRHGRAARPTTGCSRSRTSSASPPAPRRRRCRSTTASAPRSARADFDQLVDDLARRPARRRDPAVRHACAGSASAPPTAGPAPVRGPSEGRRPMSDRASSSVRRSDGRAARSTRTGRCADDEP